MKLRNKIPKIFLIFLSFILLISISVVALFVFKEPKWKETYANETVEYLYKNMFRLSEEKFVGTLLPYEILPFEDDVIIGFFSFQGEVKLYIEKEKIGLQEDIDFVETEYGIYAPVFLSVEIKQDRGNIENQLRCVFGEQERCIKKFDISKVEIYENRYPYPILTEEQSREFTLSNLGKYEKESNETEVEERRCLNLMSEYIINIQNRERILKEFSELTCKDLSTSLLYANLLEKEDPFYKQMEEKICKEYSQLEQIDVESIFLPTAIPIYNEMCNVNFVAPANPQEFLEDNIYQTPRNILYLLNNRESMEYDERMEEIKELLTRDLFTSFGSPYCLNMYICNPELINLSKVIFDE